MPSLGKYKGYILMSDKAQMESKWDVLADLPCGPTYITVLADDAADAIRQARMVFDLADTEVLIASEV